MKIPFMEKEENKPLSDAEQKNRKKIDPLHLTAQERKLLREKIAEKAKNREKPAEPDEKEREKLHSGARALVLNQKNGGVRKKAFRNIMRNNMINMALIALITIVIAIFLVSITQEYVGNFTITLDEADALKYGIEMSSTSDFAVTDTKLRADPIINATNISGTTIPTDVNLTDGSHNGTNYIAYTFYLRNTGSESFNYRYTIHIDEVTKGVDEAIRFALHYNNTKTLYGELGRGGQPESENGMTSTPFISDKIISAVTVKRMDPDTVDKYTVVIWLEGDDPECIDDILGGTIKMSMDISVVDKTAQ